MATTKHLYRGDCIEQLANLPNFSVDSIVTDPPYELGFMGKSWDNAGIAYSVELWGEALRVLKPGGHLLAFGAARTYHRMTCAIEDAGFEIRDSIHWIYGSGFPKSLDVSKAIDKAAGAEREVVGIKKRQGRSGGIMGSPRDIEQAVTIPATIPATIWQGWGTALKPAHEPIVVARKPLIGTVAANVLEHGTGALNIDACRIGEWKRWPANIVFDDDAAAELEEARYFYCAKASKKERNAGLDGFTSTHPTVKPLALMRYLIRLVTPPGGLVLDPFLGSGTTAVAAILEGFDWKGCEMTDEYWPIIEARTRWAKRQAASSTSVK